jgi:hypothetical protein
MIAGPLFKSKQLTRAIRHPRLQLRDRGWLKTWMLGTSPGRSALNEKIGADRLHELPFDFPSIAGDPSAG